MRFGDAIINDVFQQMVELGKYDYEAAQILMKPLEEKMTQRLNELWGEL